MTIRKRRDIDLVVILTKNLTSVSAWDWAAFIHGLSPIWPPVDQAPPFALVTSALVRSTALGTQRPLAIGECAGGATAAAELKAEGKKDVGYAISQAKRFLQEGVYMIMIESEGITENTDPWRTNVAARFINELGIEKTMFEAADPAVFEWYIKNYGYNINLFIDHSQIVQLECLRSGIWGTKATWGRIQGFKNENFE